MANVKLTGGYDVATLATEARAKGSPRRIWLDTGVWAAGGARPIVAFQITEDGAVERIEGDYEPIVEDGFIAAFREVTRA